MRKTGLYFAFPSTGVFASTAGAAEAAAVAGGGAGGATAVGDAGTASLAPAVVAGAAAGVGIFFLRFWAILCC